MFGIDMQTSEKCFESDMAAITDLGWQDSREVRSSRADMIWERHFPDEPRCSASGNDPLWIQLLLHDERRHGFGWRFDLEIFAQPSGNPGWFKVSMYGIESVSDIEANIQCALRAWRAVQPVA